MFVHFLKLSVKYRCVVPPMFLNIDFTEHVHTIRKPSFFSPKTRIVPFLSYHFFSVVGCCCFVFSSGKGELSSQFSEYVLVVKAIDSTELMVPILDKYIVRNTNRKYLPL